LTKKEIQKIFKDIGLASKKERERFTKMSEQFSKKEDEEEQIFIRITSNTKVEGEKKDA
jgi:hypothetical protein